MRVCALRWIRAFALVDGRFPKKGRVKGGKEPTQKIGVGSLHLFKQAFLELKDRAKDLLIALMCLAIGQQYETEKTHDLRIVLLDLHLL